MENALDVIPMSCRRPAFRNQTVISKSGTYKIDNNNYIIYCTNVLTYSEISSYLNNAFKIERISGRSGFGVKHRKEICYSPDGKPYIF